MTEFIHPFTKSDQGNAPFQIICVLALPSKAVQNANPSAYNSALLEVSRGAKHFGVKLGTCYHCGTGIMNNYVIKSADGFHSVVGCDCIRKTFWAEPMLKPKLAIVERAFKKEKKARKFRATRREKILKAMKDVGPTIALAWSMRKKYQKCAMMLETFWKFGTWSEAMGNAVINAKERLAEVSELQEAQKAQALASRFIGQIGERIELEARLVHRINRDLWSLSILETRDGQQLTTFGVCRIGDDFKKFKATVKAHRTNEKTGIKQTSIFRIKESK